MRFNCTIFIQLLAACILTSCSEQKAKVERKSGFQDFVKGYNNTIEEWLAQQKVVAMKEKIEIKKKLAEVDPADAKVIKSLESKLNANTRLLKRIDYRISKKEFISQKAEADLPQDLNWETGEEVIEKGDPNAKKGGVFHTHIPEFPPTIRPLGPNSNNSFRSELHDNIELGMVNYDYIEKKFFPSLASEWAFGNDGRTVFYKLDPDATFSDGVKVTSKDFLFSLYIRLSDNITAPFQKQYFKNQFANVTTYGDGYVSISLPEPKPMLPFYANLTAAPAHFYDEYGPDYDERYQWRVPPTTGAYTLLPEDIKKGRSITLSRVKDWWARDKKHYQYSNNVDKIVYTVIAEKTKAFELFKLGKLDTFYLSAPDYWYEKMEIPQYFKGYIEKSTFYNVFPRVPRGLFINVDKKPLDNVNIRRGIAHAVDFDRVNAVIFRGDSQRLQQFSEGYGDMTNSNVKARGFSVKKAQDYFAKAGYSTMGKDGILTNDQGERLSFILSWAKGLSPDIDRMMELLSETAKKVGLEIQLDGQQSNIAFKNLIEKRHQIAYSGWAVRPPFPRYFQFFHSENAYDEKGNIKVQTNNVNSYSNPRMDKLVETVRTAKNLDELKEAAHEVQQIVRDEAIFIPALKVAYVRMGYWRWMRWPQTKYYEFSSPVIYSPTDAYSYWIDEDLKKETEEAMKSGKEFSEKSLIFDLYKDGLPSMEDLEKRTPTQPQP